MPFSQHCNVSLLKRAEIHIHKKLTILFYFFRFATVLSHLDTMNNKAMQYRENLIRLQREVAETEQVK